ncbi:MAG: NADH-quinone oxidoreductase subunit J [Verrucomicrobia bacterium]|nr:NADH-quinone oxidoreductase subunit J [Verrucomicrobiota bacterium]
MSPVFLILAVFTLASAVGAMVLRNLIHCALCLALTFVGIAALFIQLNAEFVGLAQILVYVGAVAILIVFAVLLTRSSETPPSDRVFSRSWWLGAGVAVVTLSTILAAVVRSPSLNRPEAKPVSLTVKTIGTELMTKYILPLEVMGLLLTAAMIGAVVIAMRERKP